MIGGPEATLQPRYGVCHDRGCHLCFVEKIGACADPTPTGTKLGQHSALGSLKEAIGFKAVATWFDRAVDLVWLDEVLAHGLIRSVREVMAPNQWGDVKTAALQQRHGATWVLK